jgi:hypothetical protein
VFLSEAAVQSKAVELGLGGANRELTEAEKVQARYAIILEQTNKQQGDFARTSDSLANQQRIMSAQWADLQATLGQLVLPAVTSVVGVLTDLGTVLLFVTGATKDFDQAVKDAAINVGHFELDVASFFEKFAGHIPIIGEGVKLWDQYRGETDKSSDAVKGLDDALGQGGKGLGNFRGQLFQAQVAAGETGDEIRRFAHMSKKAFQEFSDTAHQSFHDFVFDMQAATEDTRISQRDFAKAFDAMQDDARRLATAMRKLKDDDWVNDKFLAFLTTLGPEFLIRFSKMNEDQQLKWQRDWKATNEVLDRGIIKSFDRITGALDALDKKETEHTVRIRYEYVGFDPSKPGMGSAGHGGPQ